jgi:hypothetical protein
MDDSTADDAIFRPKDDAVKGHVRVCHNTGHSPTNLPYSSYYIFAEIASRIRILVFFPQN